jgi:type IV pilus assembly protein PilB
MSDKSKLTISSDPKKLKLASKLSELEIKEKERQTEEEAEEKGLPYINLHKFPISQQAIKIIPRDQAESLQTVCILYSGEELRLASLNPRNPQVSKLAKELGDKYHANIKVYLTSKYSFEQSLEIYKTIPIITQMEGVSLTEEDLNKFDEKLQDFKGLDKLIKETGLTESINLIMAAGLKFDASDIHIESEVDTVKVRLRIDGVLHETALLPKEAWAKISNRIKLLSGLKLNITDKPQDGRFAINLKEDAVDVRVSFIPSTYGESIVMRLLRSSSIGLEFEKLGLRGKSYNDLLNEFSKPNGMILTTGPTGSGKTTTLYAILNKLNQEDTKIITLEDPIEYKLAGIIQSQVQTGEEELDLGPAVAGTVKQSTRYTFAKGLRAILRQDPDIVMVGEIRDLETADTAINAALTGHLMLSTLHTNSAAGAIPRFLAMGVKPFLLAPSLNAIIGQRLARRLCQKCKIEDKEVDNKTMTLIMNTLNEIDASSGHKVNDLSNLKFYKAKGCKECHDLGYKGRIGIYEIFTMNPEIEKMILSGQVSEYEIEKTAIKSGMITMMQDGFLKALEGLTSIEEVLKEVKA